ncbi:hypothetical protein NLX69_04870 [Rossellomorea sp. BNER]|nr:hypothetical protein [Rossellomorea sp. BNER]
MCLHRPTEEEFYQWFQDQYHISCSNITCTFQGNQNPYTLIETGSTIKEEYLIFNTIGKTFEGEDGSQKCLKVIGVLGTFMTITEELKAGQKH